MPSDTIHGFLCLGKMEKTLREIKNRETKPFIYLVSEIKDLDYFNIDYSGYENILKLNWPGPITFILKSRYDITYGIRLPDWDILRKIVSLSEEPLISTSVNFSGEPSLNDFEQIKEVFLDKADLLINDKTESSVSSTIVDLTGDDFKIIREGSKKFVSS